MAPSETCVPNITWLIDYSLKHIARATHMLYLPVWKQDKVLVIRVFDSMSKKPPLSINHRNLTPGHLQPNYESRWWNSYLQCLSDLNFFTILLWFNMAIQFPSPKVSILRQKSHSGEFMDANGPIPPLSLGMVHVLRPSPSQRWPLPGWVVH